MNYKFITAHETRLKAYHKQDGLCWLCSEPLDLFQPVWTYGSCSWEHVIPISSGGSRGWRNVVITHHECNKLRGDRFIWKLNRPPQQTWNSDRRKYLFPHKAQKDFAFTVHRLCKILKRLPAHSGLT